MFSQPHLGHPIRYKTKPHGEGERGREAAGEVCGRVAEEGGGIRFVEEGGRAPADGELVGGRGCRNGRRGIS